jgi:hypothetical protein
MKLLLLTTLILLIPFQQPPAIDREEADLLVVKFTWTRQRQNNDLMQGVQDPGPPLNDPVSLKPEPTNEPAAVTKRRDIQERRVALANAEHNGPKTSAPRQDYYFMRLEMKNVGEKTVKNIVWEFQPLAQAGDYDIKQYICTLKAKPKENKTLQLVSPSAPVKVVSADKKSQDGKVVINRIEYADGTVWKRKGWSVIIPPEMTNQIANGKCIMF